MLDLTCSTKHIRGNWKGFGNYEHQPFKKKSKKSEKYSGHRIKARQIKARQIKAHQVKTRQIKARRIKARQVKAHQVKSPCPNTLLVKTQGDSSMHLHVMPFSRESL